MGTNDKSELEESFKATAAEIARIDFLFPDEPARDRRKRIYVCDCSGARAAAPTQRKLSFGDQTFVHRVVEVPASKHGNCPHCGYIARITTAWAE